MKLQQFKKVIGVVFALSMIFSVGMIPVTTAQAQIYERHERHERHERYDYRERDKGYRDGLDRGREDAHDRRSFDPNHSDHYRDGNRAYRDGFRKGYAQGFRQNNGNRRNDGYRR